MSDLEPRLRQGLAADAAGLPEYPDNIRGATRRGRRRRLTTRLGAGAVTLAVLGGAFAAFLALRDDGTEPAVDLAAEGDDGMVETPADGEPAAEDESGAEPANADPADPVPSGPAPDCFGFATYCLGGDGEAAVAAGRAEYGEEITGPYFEGEPPPPGTYVWTPAPGLEVVIEVTADTVDQVSVSQAATLEDGAAVEMAVHGGFVLNVDTLESVLASRGAPDDVFVGGGEGFDFLLLEYVEAGVNLTYGYAQSWDLGLLDELVGLTPDTVRDAVSGRALPLNDFRAAGAPPVDDIFLADLALRGWGDVLIGMTEPELEAISALQPLDRFSAGEPDSCSILIPVGFPELGFMITNDIVSRIEVYGGLITTLSGAGIGTPESEVYGIYGDQLVESPHPYAGEQGRYLTFVPVDEADSQYRLIFETEDNELVGERTVTTFRVGLLPEVEWIEGCA